jgi:hypothetical protein
VNLHICKTGCSGPTVHPGHLCRIPDSKILSISASKGEKQIEYLKNKGINIGYDIEFNSMYTWLLINTQTKGNSCAHNLKKNKKWER